ncbi:MAG: hypothetical protein IPG79_18530 [Saprospiraceae bacterium]|nr:hypothetical protein [Saprospiraceae bacterium]
MGKWMMVSAALSMTIGTLFFITGGAKWLEKKFETHIESYESILEKKQESGANLNLALCPEKL